MQRGDEERRRSGERVEEEWWKRKIKMDERIRIEEEEYGKKRNRG